MEKFKAGLALNISENKHLGRLQNWFTLSTITLIFFKNGQRMDGAKYREILEKTLLDAAQ